MKNLLFRFIGCTLFLFCCSNVFSITIEKDRTISVGSSFTINPYGEVSSRFSGYVCYSTSYRSEDATAFSISVFSTTKTSYWNYKTKTDGSYSSYNIKALKEGVYIIYVYANFVKSSIGSTNPTYDGATIIYHITVTAKKEVTSISIPNNLSLTIGETYQINPVIYETGASTTLSWSSSNSSIATVDEGLVTALSHGKAIITCTATNGVTASCNITINPIYIDNISLAQTEIEIEEGSRYLLEYTILPENATIKDLQWNSSNENVAFVGNDGTIIGITPGYCNVKVMTTDGSNKSANCIVHVVKNTSIPIYEIKLDVNNPNMGSVSGAGKYEQNTEVEVTATPSIGHYFVKWSDGVETDKRIVILTQDMMLTAIFAISSYPISFENYDGTIIQHTEFVYGTIPKYDGDVPTKPADAQYTYTFTGWTPEIVDVVGPTTYTATYEAILNKYTIVFQNYDGSELQRSEINYGEIPVYIGATPTKASDEQYTYSFTGWDKEVITVTGEAIYTAIYNAFAEKLIVKFVNYDGTELQSSDVEYGVIPEYIGNTPTRPADVQYTYNFVGWTPEIVAITDNVTYMAVYERVLNTYTIIWQDEDGNPIKVDEVAYGETPVFSGATPTKEATAEYTYEFAGWLPKIQPATKDMYYTTFFERNKIETPVYTVNINGENCSLNINNQYPEGTVITLEAVADECFEFRQWSDGNKENPRTVTVTANTNLTAEFNKVRYTITDKTEPGTGGKIQIVGQ